MTPAAPPQEGNWPEDLEHIPNWARYVCSECMGPIAFLGPSRHQKSCSHKKGETLMAQKLKAAGWTHV